MPNQRNSKGKKSKRSNSNGDEQENGPGASARLVSEEADADVEAAELAAPRGAAPPPLQPPQVAAAAVGNAASGVASSVLAVGSSGADVRSGSAESQCASPLGCSLGRPIDMEKDEYQRVLCNNELCPYGNWMHQQCFYEWESSILVQFNCIGRARSWNEKQCRQNMWTKKGYDLAFRFCSCRCGQGHLKKDTDWYQVRRMQQEERKKKPFEKSSGRNPGTRSSKTPREISNPLGRWEEELPRRPSVDRQNSSERGAASGGPLCLGPPQRSPCDSPGLSPPAGFPFSPTAVLTAGGGGGLRGPRPLGEFLKSALHMDPQRKSLLSGGPLGRGCSAGAPDGGSHLDHGSVLPLPLSLALPLHQRLASGAGGEGSPSHSVQFLRRLDLSELLTHLPRHKVNTYHVRMEDDAQAGQGEELRRFILSALSASQRNVVNCALCHRALPVFEQFPLVDGTLFLSPSRHDEMEYDVPCHLQGRLMHLYAICVDCLEGVHKIVCIKCKSRWDGSWHQLGTMYTYDILAASPCCQARLNCKHCGKPVVDVRVGMQYFSEYSNVQQCPHCGNLDYHFVKPFSSYKVLEAY
uniref:Hdc homolog, cell cycle regulator n=1 Tax=Tetraodon nigroviridis TaxID=99883 RepID=H3CPZ1_TETNG